MRELPLAERFWAKVSQLAEGCWEWQGGRTKHGYGRFRIGRRVCRAPRVAWELRHGPIPEGMKVCHRCDNPPCVRDEHLFLGTDGDNQRDAQQKKRKRNGNTGKRICKRGHLLTPENTYHYRGRRPYRLCRACKRSYERTHRSQRRAA